MKTPAELNKRLRKERKDLGLTELRIWVTKEHKKRAENYIKLLQAGG